MVATLVRLRLTIIVNTLRGNVWQLVGAIVGALYGLGVLIGVLVALVAVSFASPEFRGTALVLAGSALILGWMIVPLATAGLDQTVDPGHLAVYPIRRDALQLALAASGVLGIPGAVTSIVVLAAAASWWSSPLAIVVAVPCAVIAVVTCVVGSRMLGAVATRVGASRRAREARTILVLIPLLLLGPILLGIGELVSRLGELLPTIARVLGFTPLGAVWAVPGSVARGEWGSAAVQFAIALATLGLLWLAWRGALTRAFELPARVTGSAPDRRGLGLFARFPGTPWGAVAARCLTYWMRDPRYAQSLITVPLIPALVFFYSGFVGAPIALVWVGPIIAMLLAISIYTDISYDNTAFALHLQSGVSGRADRLGRVAALATFAVPVTVLIVVATIAATGQWVWFVGILAISLAVLLAGFAVSSVLSAWATFPVPAPGESPFSARPGGGLGLLLSTLGTWAVLGVLVVPTFVLALLGFATSTPLWQWIALAAGLALGAVFLVVGIRWGGRILDARGPALLAQLRAQR